VLYRRPGANLTKIADSDIAGDNGDFCKRAEDYLKKKKNDRGNHNRAPHANTRVVNLAIPPSANHTSISASPKKKAEPKKRGKTKDKP